MDESHALVVEGLTKIFRQQTAVDLVGYPLPGRAWSAQLSWREAAF